MGENRSAVLLVNYGGPSGPEECREYLRNIFLDPFLIPIPSFIRPLVAAIVSARRAPKLRDIYAAMGQFSPIVRETELQAKALQEQLGESFLCMPAMRYSKPFIREVLEAVKDKDIEDIVILPMYPHESGTTTGSTLHEVDGILEDSLLRDRVKTVRSFHLMKGYLEHFRKNIETLLNEIEGRSKVLFVAHGLPVKVARKDPYPEQIAETAIEISKMLGTVIEAIELPGGQTFAKTDSDGFFQASLAWQSKVGPMKWLEPSLEDTLVRLSKEGTDNVIAVPLSFVCEHSETLYELDILAADLAGDLGMNFYRVPTAGNDPDFISGLADLVREAAA